MTDPAPGSGATRRDQVMDEVSTAFSAAFSRREHLNKRRFFASALFFLLCCYLLADARPTPKHMKVAPPNRFIMRTPLGVDNQPLADLAKYA